MKKMIILIVTFICLIIGCVNQQTSDGPINQIDSLKKVDIDKFPIIYDCKLKDKSNDLSQQTPDAITLNNINKKASILTSFNIKSGYSLGQVRKEKFFLPSGVYCLPYFQLGVKNDNNGDIVNDDSITDAFMFTEKDLQNVGWILYGDLINSSDLNNGYKNSIVYSICSNDNHIMCNVFEPLNLPGVNDGQITKESDGTKILHRFNFLRGPNNSLNYYKISVLKDGNLNIETQNIFSIDTGIMI